MKRHLLIFLILLATRFAIANPGGGLTLANMVVTGTGIKWYTAATAGSLLPSSTALVNGTTYYASQTVNGVESATRLAVTATVNSRPIPTFTAQPCVTTNSGADVTYTTQIGMSTYVWTYPGTLTTDYTISSGGGNTNSVTLKYVTNGIKTVTINYTAVNGCNAASATSSTATTVSALLAIGDSYGGGKIGYILVSADPGYDACVQHGLIAATADVSTSAYWAFVKSNEAVPGGTSFDYGTGLANTNNIIAQQGSNDCVASVARSYNGGGFADWYLPSVYEIIKICDNKLAIGNFTTGYYYTSSEDGTTNMELKNFGGSAFISSGKHNNAYKLRPVRSF
jgi:Ig-like domain CHU_C associated